MKVLHILCDLGHGGAQEYVCNLLQYHTDIESYQGEVLTLFVEGVLSERVRKLGVPVECVGLKSGRDLAGYVRLYRKLMSSDHDIVHVHFANPVVCMLVGRLNSKNIFTEHGGGLLSGDWRYKLVYRYFSGNFCRFIAISESIASVMHKNNSRIMHKITVVPNGTNINSIDQQPPVKGEKLPLKFSKARFRVGIIGRLVPQKDISTFLSAAAIIARECNDVVFPIVGDGYLRERLEKEASNLGLGDRVLFLGFREDAISILKRFDVFLFTSKQEGFGLVLIESMAAHVPVVAVRKETAVSEIIGNQEEGIIVDDVNPSALADKVLQLLNNPDMRKRIARRAREKVVDQFSMEKNAKRLLHIYNECLVGK